MVILSMVRCKNDVGFLKIPNRLNVAISRARELFIVVWKQKTYRDCKLATVKAFHDNLTKYGQEM